jgi:hypothetical protein
MNAVAASAANERRSIKSPNKSELFYTILLAFAKHYGLNRFALPSTCRVVDFR